MRILIAVEGTRGDVYPMLALARHALAHGHEVRLVAPPDFGDDVRACGAEFVSMGVSVREFIIGHAAALHSRGPQMFAEMKKWGDESIVSQFALLPDAARDCDYVLAAGTILAASSAAELAGIPYRFIAYTPALLPSCEHTPAMLPFQLRSRLANRALWWLSEKAMNAAVRRDLNRKRAELGLAPIRDAIRHVLSERPLIAVDHALARMPDDGSIRFEQIRCLHPHRPDPLPPKLEAFLEQGPKPVYLGFGSMPDPDPARTTERLFDAIRRLGSRALISRGWAGLGEGPVPEDILVIDPVPHSSLFPRTALVVHHGGAGTTHTAARSGVPQIVVPHVLDQFYFARRIADLGVGPPGIPRAGLSVERLSETLRATLDNEHLERRASELALALAELGPTDPDLDRVLA
jgi:UDP:flavonoid glycosyltransferase YjiC (YdhE family)